MNAKLMRLNRQALCKLKRNKFFFLTAITQIRKNAATINLWPLTIQIAPGSIIS